MSRTRHSEDPPTHGPECPLCIGLYFEPVTLSCACSHRRVICFVCIINIKEQNHGTVVCPYCRRPCCDADIKTDYGVEFQVEKYIKRHKQLFPDRHVYENDDQKKLLYEYKAWRSLTVDEEFHYPASHKLNGSAVTRRPHHPRDRIQNAGTLDAITIRHGERAGSQQDIPPAVAVDDIEEEEEVEQEEFLQAPQFMHLMDDDLQLVPEADPFHRQPVANGNLPNQERHPDQQGTDFVNDAPEEINAYTGSAYLRKVLNIGSGTLIVFVINIFIVLFTGVGRDISTKALTFVYYLNSAIYDFVSSVTTQIQELEEQHRVICSYLCLLVSMLFVFNLFRSTSKLLSTLKSVLRGCLFCMCILWVPNFLGLFLFIFQQQNK